MEHLKNALTAALGKSPSADLSTSATQAPSAPTNIDLILPDPTRSEWARALRNQGADLPAKPTLGQLRARSDALVKELKNNGQKRASSELQKLRDDFEKEREKAAWGAIKAAFDEQQLPERAYRALKQTANLDPTQPLARLLKSKGNLKGMGADKVRDVLLGTASLN